MANERGPAIMGTGRVAARLAERRSASLRSRAGGLRARRQGRIAAAAERRARRFADRARAAPDADATLPSFLRSDSGKARRVQDPAAVVEGKARLQSYIGRNLKDRKGGRPWQDL